jgi:hypothetical protein
MRKNKRLVLVWAAASWAFLFAFISFYWAAGGQLGVSTLGFTIETLNASPSFMAMVWLSGVLKLAAGSVAIAMLLNQKKYRWAALLPFAAFGIGVLCATYGLLNVGARAVMVLGIIPTPCCYAVRCCFMAFTFLESFLDFGWSAFHYGSLCM